MTYLVETIIVHRIEAECSGDARENARDLTKTSGYESVEIHVYSSDGEKEFST